MGVSEDPSWALHWAHHANFLNHHLVQLVDGGGSLHQGLDTTTTPSL